MLPAFPDRELAAALALAERCLAGVPRMLVATLADDPLRLDLPPDGGGGQLDPDALRALAALYLAAELEQAGVVPVAEVLAEQRADLPVTTLAAAERLERFAQRARDWYDRDQRDRVFARVFGLGRPAADDGRGLVNREFEGLLAALCNAVVRAGDERAPSAGVAAALARAADALTDNLAQRRYGTTLLAARSLGEQLRAAVELLQDQGVRAMFGAASMWQVIRAVLADQAPDLGRLVGRGQAGQQVLVWLAERATGTRIAPIPLPVVAAARWLVASGFELRAIARSAG